MASRVKQTEATEKTNGAAPVAPKPIQLVELNRKTISVKVVGISSLIVHRFGQKAIREIEQKQQREGRKQREAKNPEEDFQESLYRDSQGRYCFPASGFKKAMVSAATSIDDKINFPKTKIRQAVFVKGDLIPLEHEFEPRMRTDPVRLPSGGADMRYRAEFEKWSATLTIEFNESVFSAEQVVNILNLAGFAVGIGDWRPEKDGEHGRFEVAH